MAEVSGRARVDVPQERVWAYLLEIENWIADFEGYAGHTTEPDGSVVVRMRARVGFVTKASRLRVDITEAVPPSKLRFVLRGLDDPLAGEGQLECRPAGPASADIEYRINLAAEGIAAALFNEFLERVVPGTIGDLAQRVAARLSGSDSISTGSPPSPTVADQTSASRPARSGGLARRTRIVRLRKRLMRDRAAGGWSSAAPSDRFDLVVVGSGGAGLAAALTAHDAGGRVVVVEAAEHVGGTFAYSTGLVWVPGNRHLMAEGVDDTREAALTYIRPRTSGRHDDEVLEAFLDAAPRVIDYLERIGVPFEIVPGYPDEQAEEPGGRAHGRYLSSPLFCAGTELDAHWREVLVHSPNYGGLPVSWCEIQEWGGFGSIGSWDWDVIGRRVHDDYRAFGMSTAGFLLRAAIERGIPILTGTSARSLYRRGDRIAGVVVDDGRGERRLEAARGVVLATGSYDNDPEMKRMLEPHPPTITLGAPTVDGSGLRMGLEHGAQLAVMGGQLLAPAYHVVGEEVDGEPVHRLLVREPGFPGSIIVNRAGRRFCDEAMITDLRREVARLDPHARTYPNFPAFLIFDQRWKDTYPLGPLLPGHVPEWLASGGSAEDLAGRLGVDGAQLTETLKRFNAHASAGTDPDFRRGETPFSRANGDPSIEPNPCLLPLTGRLYGIELKLGIVGSNAGLLVNGSAQVRHVRGGVIDGLYAAGNAAANQVGGLWYNAGLMNARGLAFGWLAARHALGNAPTPEGRAPVIRSLTVRTVSQQEELT